MSFVNWSLLFSHSFSGSLAEALLKKGSVLTCVALSTVLLLIKARATIHAAALLRHRHGWGSLLSAPTPLGTYFLNFHAFPSLKAFLVLIQSQKSPCSDNRRCRCWVYISQEHPKSFSLLIPFPTPGWSPLPPPPWQWQRWSCPVGNSNRLAPEVTISSPALKVRTIFRGQHNLRSLTTP